MHCGKKKIEKLTDWMERAILSERKFSYKFNFNYVNSLIKKVDRLIDAEKEYDLPGGTSYSSHIKASLLSVRRSIELGAINIDIIADRLDQLADRLDEAIEIFKKGK